MGKHYPARNYLPPRQATDEAYWAWTLQPSRYQQLMDLGFRRSGLVVYRPRCEGCNACQPMRVPVAEFRPSKSQRRVLKRNIDVKMELSEPRLTPEKVDLYQRYLAAQHQGTPQDGGEASMRDFLYTSCTATLEACYRDARGALLGVTILDLCRESLSSVYHFFEPREAKRSLGVYSILAEIELCRAKDLPWFYLGYWIKGCPTMEYKASYQPFELLVDGVWKRARKERTSDAPRGSGQ